MDDEFKQTEIPEDESERESSAEQRSTISADLIRGHINTIILRTLYERDKYGYEIIEEIDERSHGQYTMKQPTLYSALKRLESQGYINAYWKTDEVSQGGRRKYFTLTDSGREIAEKNQAEWEYSRTVIDSLISDKNFDFTQPPPAAVDFKILKSSTSRVPVVKDDEDDDDEDENQENETQIREVKFDEPPVPREVVTEEPIPPVAPMETVVTEPEAPATEPAPPQQEPVMTEEQRRQLHENYLKLISEPVRTREESAEMPYADDIDTDKLIYNNRPEPERDYRNLVNSLFVKTIKVSPPADVPITEVEAKFEEAAPNPVASVPPVTTTTKQVADTVRLDDAGMKACDDGLTVNTSDYSVTTPRRKRYNRGAVLFKCSLIIGVVMLLEFALCLIFKNDLGVTLAYPFVIFALAFAQVLIFGVLCYTDLGKTSRKPTSFTYLSSCIVVAIIAILIICVISLLVNVDFSSAGDIMAKIVIPCIITLNIPSFAALFYLFSKS